MGNVCLPYYCSEIGLLMLKIVYFNGFNIVEGSFNIVEGSIYVFHSK